MSQYQCKICRTMHSHRDECPFQQDALASSTVQYVTKISRPTGSNADEWALFLSEHNGATEYIAVQIAEALERALADGAAMRRAMEKAAVLDVGRPIPRGGYEAALVEGIVRGQDEARDYVKAIVAKALSDHPGDKLLAVVKAAQRYREGGYNGSAELDEALDALDGTEAEDG